MSYTQALPVAVAVLETGAGLVFLCAGNARMATMWLAYGVAAWVLASVQ